MADDGVDFSPLTPEEREVAAQETAPGDERHADKPTLPPADAEPAETAAARLFRHPPDAIWRYATAEGETAFYVCRYNKKGGRKDYLPLCWFPGDGWRSKHWPAPRPFYNLDKVAARPDAPVIICEGEKSADAAARIFVECIAITASGGAKAAAKTDWTPLAGRRAHIWPDADSPGEKYAHEVAAILAALECEVSIIDAAALAHIDPNGGQRESTKKGWDAADAIDEWRDLDALHKAAGGLAKPFEPGPPASGSIGVPKMGAKGLTVEVKGKGENKTTEKVWIAAPFEVLGECRDPRGESWGKLLRWRDADGREHVRHVADRDLHGEPAALCAGLADHGLRINPARQREFRGYLAAVRLKRRITVVSRTGWHEVGGRSVFVLPGETIGPCGAERVILDAAASGPYETQGTVDEWRDGAAKLASGHAVLVLAISAALAGPLLGLAGYEGGGLHLLGRSSTGKTTALRLAASVWGRGDTPGFVRAWRATANGLEGAAAGATDTALILDELGQVEARELAATLYMLANGSGKARAHRDGSLRDPKSWRVLTLSSGEVPIDAKLAEDHGRKSRAGQLVRMLNVPADRGRGFGVFDGPGPEGEAAALSKACMLAAALAYGTTGPEFVRRLIRWEVSGNDVRALVADFAAAHVPQDADGQVIRAAERLGLVATAGELATELGVTGWRKGEAREAAAWALKQWIEGRGGLEPAEVRQAIETVRRFIEAHGEARFDNLDDPDARPVPNRAGWRKGQGQERSWLIPSETWKSEICAGHDPKFVARVLAERGMTERAPDGFQPVHKINGKSMRVYVVKPRIFDGGELED
jgi:putative DNA primase/helicase